MELKKYIIGIDASNLRMGGGRTHLIELLRHADPIAHGISKIIIWGSKQTLSLLEDRSWLIKINPPSLEKGVFTRFIWQLNKLGRSCKELKCDLLFVPGGTYLGNFHPIVTMSRNLLPFEWSELKRFGWSGSTFKLLLLRITQALSFKKADGLIFLTDYAKNKVEKEIGRVRGKVKIIPHGIGNQFKMQPKKQFPIQNYSTEHPLHLLYVSIINQYKHQWHVVEAVSNLRHETGWPIVLDLVGPYYKASLLRLRESIRIHDPEGRWVRYHGPLPFENLHNIYSISNIGIFASSCENMPNILLEKMGAGLPIACSNKGPMPEIIGSSGVLFDPENPNDISFALKSLISSINSRTDKSNSSYFRASNYSWYNCSNNTLSFLIDIINSFQEKKN